MKSDSKQIDTTEWCPKKTSHVRWGKDRKAQRWYLPINRKEKKEFVKQKNKHYIRSCAELLLSRTALKKERKSERRADEAHTRWKRCGSKENTKDHKKKGEPPFAKGSGISLPLERKGSLFFFFSLYRVCKTNMRYKEVKEKRRKKKTNERADSQNSSTQLCLRKEERKKNSSYYQLFLFI